MEVRTRYEQLRFQAGEVCGETSGEAEFQWIRFTTEGWRLISVQSRRPLVLVD
jgi:hypothetical protein